ncbi:MAG: hypothetical protein K8R58_15335 [Bacteroidales bacterium]|nr:hypothetical protein [Bacteroidales bacterium]
MKKTAIIIFLNVLIALTYEAQSQEYIKYPDNVGDIKFNQEIDNPNFILCDSNNIKQYYNFGKPMQIHGEKTNLIKYFSTNYRVSDSLNERGYVTIRFVVNCQGVTGRFRVYEMDNDCKSKKFSSNITQQILLLTKNFNQWIIGEKDGVKYDYYQYLTFKIEDGKIKEILP